MACVESGAFTTLQSTACCRFGPGWMSTMFALHTLFNFARGPTLLAG